MSTKSKDKITFTLEIDRPKPGEPQLGIKEFAFKRMYREAADRGLQMAEAAIPDASQVKTTPKVEAIYTQTE